MKSLEASRHPRAYAVQGVAFEVHPDALAVLLGALAVRAKGWTLPGTDAGTLATDAANQRSERAAHDAVESTYRSTHETFGAAQEARYERFAAALNAARGAFRDDKAVLAELLRFKRVLKRSTNGNQPAPSDV